MSWLLKIECTFIPCSLEQVHGSSTTLHRPKTGICLASPGKAGPCAQGQGSWASCVTDSLHLCEHLPVPGFKPPKDGRAVFRRAIRLDRRQETSTQINPGMVPSCCLTIWKAAGRPPVPSEGACHWAWESRQLRRQGDLAGPGLERVPAGEQGLFSVVLRTVSRDWREGNIRGNSSTGRWGAILSQCWRLELGNHPGLYLRGCRVQGCALQKSAHHWGRGWAEEPSPAARHPSFSVRGWGWEGERVWDSKERRMTADHCLDQFFHWEELASLDKLGKDTNKNTFAGRP